MFQWFRFFLVADNSLLLISLVKVFFEPNRFSLTSMKKHIGNRSPLSSNLTSEVLCVHCAGVRCGDNDSGILVSSVLLQVLDKRWPVTATSGIWEKGI